MVQKINYILRLTIEVTVNATSDQDTESCNKDVRVKMTKNDDGSFRAAVTYSVTEDGKTAYKRRDVLNGTKEEVDTC